MTITKIPNSQLAFPYFVSNIHETMGGATHDTMRYLSLERLLEFSLVEVDLFLMLLAEVLQSLGQFAFILLLGSSVHLHQSLLMALLRPTHLLHKNTQEVNT